MWPRGVGSRQNLTDQAHAPEYAKGPSLWGKDAEGNALPFSGYAEWALPHAWRTIDRSSERKQERLEAWLLFRRWIAPAPGRSLPFERSAKCRLEELGRPSEDARRALRAFEEELLLQESERPRILAELSNLPLH
jgi:hypothetical protein